MCLPLSLRVRANVPDPPQSLIFITPCRRQLGLEAPRFQVVRPTRVHMSVRLSSHACKQDTQTSSWTQGWTD